jgi:tetratricopeptide (TPR) repeat protein
VKEILDLIDEITGRIVQSTIVTVKGGDPYEFQRRVERHKGQVKTEAILRVFEAREANRRYNVEDNLLARRLAEEAIALEPGFPPGYFALATSYVLDVFLGSTQAPMQSLAQAEKLLGKATQLEDFAAARSLLGRIHSMRGEHEKALAEGEKALKLEPNSADAHAFLGMSLAFAGDPEKAIQRIQTALRLNPIPPTLYFLLLGHAYRVAGRYDEASAAYKKAIQLEPRNELAHIGLASSSSLAGQEEEARAAAKEVLRLNPNFSAEGYARMYRQSKDPEMVNRIVNSLYKAGLK